MSGVSGAGESGAAAGAGAGVGAGDGAVLARVEGLRIAFGSRVVAEGVSFEVRAGRAVALVGESGSGKSVTARALVGLVGPGSRVAAEALEVGGRSMLGRAGADGWSRGPGAAAWRGIRGAEVGLVVQDALVSLDPLRPIGREIADALRLHTSLSPRQRGERVLELLEAVGMPDPVGRVRQRSGELSGGLRQRALIASALAADPPLLIADEPTTALDSTVQAQILALFDTVRARGTGLLFISHDLGVVSRVADDVVVMRAGRVVESGPVARVLGDPRHEYTKALLAAVPAGVPRGVTLSPGRLDVAGRPAPTATRPALATGPTATHAPAPTAAHAAAPTAAAEPPAMTAEPAPIAEHARVPAAATAGPAPTAGPALLSAAEPPATAAPLLAVTGVSKTFGERRAVDDVSFTLEAGSTLGLVGESGSGKTTVARIVLGLTEPDGGGVALDGEPWAPARESARRPRRSAMGAVYQDALSSFDPRLTVGRILTDALPAPRAGNRRAGRAGDTRTEVERMLAEVGLSPDLAAARPLHLSGGQRQRVSIARALAPRPRLLVLDEPVSALDVSVQAQILDLLDRLQRERGVAYLFISHDLGVVRHMSDRIAVMKDGVIVEQGDATTVFESPQHPFTRELLAAALTL
ncbi:dipeptide ABC transporter ATP-binding protein [Herbiconiux sp. A18JL235]|uniref:Dipeptide ABC transporter ATP-binding protein n=1 Tax=Herbiconiux sp. A18JL235 TaxID=3152363 RepID=A0AB39BCE7_9MICO